MFSKLFSALRGNDSGPTEMCVGDRVKTLDGLCSGMVFRIHPNHTDAISLPKTNPIVHERTLVVLMIARGTNHSGLTAALPGSFSRDSLPDSPTHEYPVFSALHLRKA